MSGFQKPMRIEENIWWWSRQTLKVLVNRRGPTIPLPVGYEPKVRGSKIIVDGAGLDALLTARRERDAILGRGNAGSPVEQAERTARATTLERAYELMIANLNAKVADGVRRKDTARGYKSRWPRIAARFGKVNLLSITSAAIQLWLDEQRARVEAITVSHYRQVLSRVFNFAIKRGMYPYQNPALLTEAVELPADVQGRRLSDDEITALLEACFQSKYNGEFWYCYFAVLTLTGLRATEAARLRWEDIDWAARKMIPNHQKARRRKDVFELTPELEEILRMRRPEESGWIFTGPRRNPDGNPVTYASALRAVKRIARRAKLNDPDGVGLHGFRRANLTAAQDEAGGDALAFMEVGRQRDMRVARRYVPALSERGRQLFLRTSRKFGKVIRLEDRLRKVA